MQIRRAALAVVLALTVAASLSALARAADQTVLGKSFLVKDPQPAGDAALRGVVVLGKEPASNDSVVGNPIASGATVEIIANGTNPSDQVFTLPAGAFVAGGSGWKALGAFGYSYKDSGGANGPIKSALIKKAGSGTFIAKVVIKGALGPGPQPHITVRPPAPGTNGGMIFTITSGDSYCVAFGGSAGGALTNAPTHGTPNKVFKIVSKPASPTTEFGCPSQQTVTTTSSTTSTTIVTGGVVLKGALTATVGRFNYNLTVGLPGANSACNTSFPGTHACSYTELQSAQTAGDLVGLKDTGNNTVTSFWAIDGTAPALQQCNDDVISGLNWEYATAHTASRGEKVPLNNGTGALGALQMSVQCNISGTAWVGCCQ